jgi:hypothetical protein
MTDIRITFRYFFTAFLAVLITWLFHEFAHWLTSESLGYDTIMRLNATLPEKGQKVSEWHHIITSAAGPLATILQAIILFILLKNNWNKYLYIFLFTAVFMRSLASIMNVIQPNDEGRISVFLGVGLYTLPLLVSGFLYYLCYNISKKYRLTLKFNALTLVIVLLFSSILILADQLIGIRIL